MNTDNYIAGCFTQGLRQRMMVREYKDVLTGSFRANYNSNLKLITNVANINIDFRAICGKIEGKKI